MYVVSILLSCTGLPTSSYPCCGLLGTGIPQLFVSRRGLRQRDSAGHITLSLAYTWNRKSRTVTMTAYDLSGRETIGIRRSSA